MLKKAIIHTDDTKCWPKLITQRDDIKQWKSNETVWFHKMMKQRITQSYDTKWWQSLMTQSDEKTC